MASNRPTTAELLTAVREFLDGDVREAVAASDVNFKLNIALNVLRLVEREVELGPRYEQAEVLELQQLLSSEETSVAKLNEALCRRIREGVYDEEGSARELLLRHLRSATLNKLAIDNPSYSTFRSLAGDNDN